MLRADVDAGEPAAEARVGVVPADDLDLKKKEGGREGVEEREVERDREKEKRSKEGRKEVGGKSELVFLISFSFSLSPVER